MDGGWLLPTQSAMMTGSVEPETFCMKKQIKYTIIDSEK